MLIQWQVAQDKLQFDIGDVAKTMEPTKRNLVSITAKFFDPLGIVSPVTILFKIFCQQICEAKLGLDDPPYLDKWTQLLSMLQGARTITIPRCVNLISSAKTARLMGFCDAFTKAYAAIVYFRVEDESYVDVKRRPDSINTCSRTLVWSYYICSLLAKLLKTQCKVSNEDVSELGVPKTVRT